MQKHLLYVIPPPPQKKEGGDVIYGWSHRNKTAKVSLQFLQQTRWLLSRSEKKRCKRQSHQKKNIYFTPEKEGEFFQLNSFLPNSNFIQFSQWSDICKTYICTLIQDGCIHTYLQIWHFLMIYLLFSVQNPLHIWTRMTPNSTGTSDGRFSMPVIFAKFIEFFVLFQSEIPGALPQAFGRG